MNWIGDICDPGAYANKRKADSVLLALKFIAHKLKKRLRKEHPEWRNATLKRKVKEAMERKKKGAYRP